MVAEVPILLFLLSLLLGLVLIVLAIVRWRSSWKLGLTCLIGAILLQIWWMFPITWSISPNVRMYTEFHIKKEPSRRDER